MGILNRTRTIVWLFCFPALLLGGLFTVAIAAESQRKKVVTSGNAPVVIRSDSLEIDNKKKVVLFTGSVEAQKEDMVITCQKMFVHYQENDRGRAAEKGFKIDKIVAKGNVRIDRADGGSATGDEAVYYEDEEKVVLNGRPMVKQGDDYVEGSVITLFLKEDRSVVEGGSDQKAKAVLTPRNRKK